MFFVGFDGTPEAPQAPAPISFEPPAPAESVEAPFSDPLASPETWTPEPTPAEGAGIFQEIVDFGNASQVLGNLSYTVYVQGIEIADTREKLKEALQDSRFGWDAESLIASIRQGSLMFQDLSPVKAVVLINRIKFLPIRISWRQNIL